MRSMANEGITYTPGTVEQARIVSAAQAYLEETITQRGGPSAKPSERNAKQNHWLMAEVGVAQQENGKREVCYIPAMRIKAVWLPVEMWDLTRIAYELMAAQGHAVPPDYGALLHVTRMGRNGIGVYERDELVQAMDYGVIFNMAESNHDRRGRA